VPLKLRVFVYVLCLVVSPLAAEDARIAAELDVPSMQSAPLRQALGERAFHQAFSSGKYSYITNAKCRLCHREFFVGRRQDGHDHTFRKLVKSGHGTQQRCLGCHTTGFGVPGGFVSVEQTPQLMNVQCEGCHGPGSEHMRLNAKGGLLAGTDRPEILKKMCYACHTVRWDRAFEDFDKAYNSYKTPRPGEDTH